MGGISQCELDQQSKPAWAPMKTPNQTGACCTESASSIAIPPAQPAPVERAVPAWRLTLVATMTLSRGCCLSQVPSISSDLPTVASDMGALYASAVSATHRKERPSQGGRGAARMRGGASHTTTTTTCTERYSSSRITSQPDASISLSYLARQTASRVCRRDRSSPGPLSPDDKFKRERI
jgi:hypothetical protein